MKNLVNQIFLIKNEEEFEDIALEVFNYQARNNEVYRFFLEKISIDAKDISSVRDIPFLPINFFKSKKILTGNRKIEKEFKSSGTSKIQSSHYVADINVYIDSFTKGFEKFYGNVEDYTVLALLPSYLERDGSSLIYMVDYFIKKSNDKRSGFFVDDYEKLSKTVEKLNFENKKTLFLGVPFGLLDFVESYDLNLGDSFILMETGGMKGKRREMIREDLHDVLKEKLKIEYVHSEYGMTELLSQAYSDGKSGFKTPNWMKVLVRDLNDPFCIFDEVDKSGGINVIDLANINSCSFISTQDIGVIDRDKSFRVLGRIDNTEMRGCNLMLSDI